MSCRLEKLIALHAGGELGRRDALRAAEHLDGCPECRFLYAELVAERASLARLSGDASAAEPLAAVRARVLERIAGGKPSWLYAFRWKYAAATGLAAVMLAWGLLPRRPPVAPPPQPPAPQVATRPLATPAPVPPAVVAVRRAPGAPKGATQGAAWPVATREPSEPLVVKLLTDDPNVIIIWLIDQKKEEI